MGDGSSESAAGGYGEGWEELRQQTLRRDGYACTRCGAQNCVLQAHHIVPRSVGGPDRLENLLTLCRPCHGVIHPGNRSFDDVRDEAALFPDRSAPHPVARMRTADDQLCARCGSQYDASQLVAWTDLPADSTHSDRAHLILCKPCTGHLCTDGRIRTRDALEGMGRFSLSELTGRWEEASVRSSLFAPPAVSVRRPPRTRRERLIDDTPLRFLVNSVVGRWVVIAVACYFLLVVGYSVLV